MTFETAHEKWQVRAERLAALVENLQFTTGQLSRRSDGEVEICVRPLAETDCLVTAYLGFPPPSVLTKLRCQVRVADEHRILKVGPFDRRGQFRLRGLGMPKTQHPSLRGDLYVKVQAQLPRDLSSREQELFQELHQLRKERGP